MQPEERNGVTLTENEREALHGVLTWLGSHPQPVLNWHAEQSLGYPEYDERVHDVRRALSAKFWLHYEYVEVLRAVGSEGLFPPPDRIAEMKLEELCAAMTAFHRGERFADGHMGRLIENGAALALVNRALAFCEAFLGTSST